MSGKRIMKYSDQWDELDFLFNRAKLKTLDTSTSKKVRIKLIHQLSEILSKLNITFYLDKKTSLIFNTTFTEKVYEDFFVVEEKNFNLILETIDKFTDFNFNVVLINEKKISFEKQGRVLTILSSFEKLNNPKIKIEEVIDGDKNFLINKSFKINSNKKYLNNFKKFLKKFYLNTFKSNLNKDDFLKLDIELNYSKSWILRKPHLDIVTNSGKNRKIYEIVDYFSANENLDKLSKKIIDTDNSEVYEEPIYANREFWNNGNNYFIYSIIYGFRKNVTPYKNANDYIIKNNKLNLYSKEYYESLEIMDDDEIVEFLKKNPIEILNNSIVSGKHRAFAMVGRIVKDEQYFNFKVKYV